MKILMVILSILFYFKIRHSVRSWMKKNPTHKITLWLLLFKVIRKALAKRFFGKSKRYSEAEYQALEMDYHKEKDKADFWKQNYFKALNGTTK